MPGRTITRLLEVGVFDAPLVALCWLLLEGRLPLVISGEVGRATRSDVAAALRSLVGQQASSDLASTPPLLMALDDGPPARATASLRSWLRNPDGPAPTVLARSASLAALLDLVQEPPLELDPDEVRGLGLVIFLARPAVGRGTGLGPLRAVAAHYLRPLERDGQGHLQRRPPAVLATWDRETEAFAHFAWGVTPELADRVGRSQAGFEEALSERAALLGALVKEGILDAPDLERALLPFRTVRTRASTMPA